MRVTFRANFQGRKGLLATPGFKWPNPPVETIEVFRKGEKWFARALPSKNPLKLPDGATKGTMTDTVQDAFEKQLTKWTMHDAQTGQPIDPDSVTEDPNGNFEKKELTHVSLIGAPPSKIGPNYFATICGQEVHVRQIRSTRGHNPPDCKVCRVEWEKTKPEEKLPA